MPVHNDGLSGFNPIDGNIGQVPVGKNLKSDLAELRGDEPYDEIAERVLTADSKETDTLAKEQALFIEGSSKEDMESVATTTAAMIAGIESKQDSLESEIVELKDQYTQIQVNIEEWKGQEDVDEIQGERNRVNIAEAEKELENLEEEIGNGLSRMADLDAAKQRLAFALDDKLTDSGMEKIRKMVDEFREFIDRSGNLEDVPQEPETTLGKGVYDMQNATPAGAKNVVGQLNLKKGDSIHTACAMKAVLNEKIDQQIRENGELYGQMEAIERDYTALNEELQEVQVRLFELGGEIERLEAENEDGQLGDEITELEERREELTEQFNDIQNVAAEKRAEFTELEDKHSIGGENLRQMYEARDSLDAKIEELGTNLDTDSITSGYETNLKESGKIEGNGEKVPSLNGRAKNLTSLVGKLLKESAGDPAIQHFAKKVGPSILGALLTLLVAGPILTLIGGPLGFLGAGKMLAASLKNVSKQAEQTMAEQKRMGLNPLDSLIGRIKNIGGEVAAEKLANEVPDDEFEDDDDAVEGGAAAAAAKADKQAANLGQVGPPKLSDTSPKAGAKLTAEQFEAKMESLPELVGSKEARELAAGIDENGGPKMKEAKALLTKLADAQDALDATGDEDGQEALDFKAAREALDSFLEGMFTETEVSED